MPPTVREQIVKICEQNGFHVLADHQISPQLWVCIPTSLVDALTALLTRVPDRAALTALLRRHHKDSIGACSCYICSDLEEDILAWYRGDAPGPRWCEHLYREQVDDQWAFRASAAVSVVSFGGVKVSEWTCCPICAAPRPAAGG